MLVIPKASAYLQFANILRLMGNYSKFTVLSDTQKISQNEPYEDQKLPLVLQSKRKNLLKNEMEEPVSRETSHRIVVDTRTRNIATSSPI